MKAAVRDRYGPPEVVRVEDVDRPVPSDDGVLVRVRAASVNRADLDGLYPRWQFTRLFFGVRRPRSHRLGLDAAGVVESVGKDVTRFKPGDEVFADLFAYGTGAFGEFVAAPEKAFALMPAGMSFEEAATLPHSAVLALQGLRLRNGRTPRAGDKVMIVGASGNVGPFAVQIAKSLGADVTGVSSTAKVDFVRSLGADHVISYQQTDPARTGRRYDWILDSDAHHSILSWRDALLPKGAYVALGGPASWFAQALVQQPAVALATDKSMGLLLWWKPFHADDVEKLKDLIAAGKLRPVIDRRFPLGEIVDALRWVDDGHARGKVIVTT
jgi:NADPH:quinone reductase-like Zn-dependent oxidoreductase